jgi:hypothetical protein
MIRFVFRFVGLWVLAAGFVALVRDGTKSIAGNALFMTPLAEDWNNLHEASRRALEDGIARDVIPYVGSWVWDPVMLTILGAPTFLVLGILGSLLILIGRKKRRLIGYARD